MILADGKSLWLDNVLKVTLTIPSNLAARPGDFWIIPTRADRSAPLWPKADLDAPDGIPPHGPTRVRLPLALLDNNGGVTETLLEAVVAATPSAVTGLVQFGTDNEVTIESNRLNQLAEPDSPVPVKIDDHFGDHFRLLDFGHVRVVETLSLLQMYIINDPKSFDVFAATPTWSDVRASVQRFVVNREKLTDKVKSLLTTLYFATGANDPMEAFFKKNPNGESVDTLTKEIDPRSQLKLNKLATSDPDPSLTNVMTALNVNWTSLKAFENKKLADFQKDVSAAMTSWQSPALDDVKSLEVLWRSAQNTLAILNAWPFDKITKVDWA